MYGMWNYPYRRRQEVRQEQEVPCKQEAAHGVTLALADVYILPTKIRGPSQLAVHLDQLTRGKEPITEALILYIGADNNPGIAWSELTISDLLQLHQFLTIVIDDVYREEWREVLIPLDD